MHFLFLSGLFLSIMFPLFCLPSWLCVCVCRTTRSWSCSGWFITVECSTKSERRCGLSFWDTTSLAWAKRRWVRYSARAHTHTHILWICPEVSKTLCEDRCKDWRAVPAGDAGVEGLRGDRQAAGEGDAVGHLCQALLGQQHRQPRPAARPQRLHAQQWGEGLRAI